VKFNGSYFQPQPQPQPKAGPPQADSAEAQMPVEQVQPEADQPSAEAATSSKQWRTYTSYEASKTTNATLGILARLR